MATYRPFKPLGGKPKSFGEPPRKPRSVRTNLPKAPNYLKIKEQVEQAIALLPENQRLQIPEAGTLPEKMCALALCWLGYQFQAQRPEDGGRLRIAGSVIDLMIFFGAVRVALRVMGNYWHTLPGRAHKDVVQAERLRSRQIRVVDVWEQECYEKWNEGGFKNFIDDKVKSAA